MESLQIASISQKYSHLINDPVAQKFIKEEFSNLIEIIVIQNTDLINVS